MSRLVATALVLVLSAGCSCFAPVSDDGGSPVDGGSWTDGGSWPDGGTDAGLERPCPLIEGVCRGASSRWNGAGWTACDYGPDYQVTERRCDGLDNDCDGRVDVSFARQLLAAGAGRFRTQLTAAEVDRAQFTKTPEGMVVTLPNDLLVLDDELTVVGTTRFPILYNSVAKLFPSGGEWIRVAYEFQVPSPGRGCVFAHRVFSDGGFPLATDGGIELLLWRCASSINPLAYGFAADVVSDGWVAVITDFETPVEIGLRWIRLGVDGGLREGTYDAGAGWAGGTFVRDGVGGALVNVAGQGRSQVWRAAPPAPGMTLLFDEPTEYCAAATDDPVTFACRAYDAGRELTTWRTSTGGALAPAFEGYPVYTVGRRGSPVAIGNRAPDLDGGWVGVPVGDVYSADGGTLRLVFRPGPAPIRYLTQVIELGPEPSIVAWAEASPGRVTQYCPNCDLEGFFAAYVCIP